MRVIVHIDLNSYFARVEQQANPRLRGRPVGVTGGDRLTRTVLGTASVEAKQQGVKTGMQIWQAKKICPEIVTVPGDSDKYLYITKKFINILKDYSPYLEIFSIDESFLELPFGQNAITVALKIKQRIKSEIGEWISCSIGISYNKLMAKLGSSLQKLDGLVVIPDQSEAIRLLDRVELDEVCGIGPRIKQKLSSFGVTSFKKLRAVPKDCLVASFKSYGETLYQIARGIDDNPIMPFYDKEEVKSVGHRHTIDHDTDNLEEIKQVLLKISEMVALRVRSKRLVSKTVHCWYRSAFESRGLNLEFPEDGKQQSLNLPTDDGLSIFQTAWGIFHQVWNQEKIRMIGVSLSNLQPSSAQNLSLLPEERRQKVIVQTLDKINSKFGDFTLTRGVLLGSRPMLRRANSYLADRRFRI